MRLLLACSCCAFASPSWAGSLNAWGPAVGERTVALMPFTQTTADGVFGQLYAAAGLGRRVDLNVGFGSEVGWRGDSVSTLELLPRLFVHETLGVGAHLYYSPGASGVIIGPEVHGEWSAGPFVLAANLGWTPTVGEKARSPGEIWGIFAPEVYVHPRASVFLEIDPVFAVEDAAWSATLVPGVGVIWDEEGAHSASLGIGLTPGKALAWSVGLAWTSTWTSSRNLDPRIVEIPSEEAISDLQFGAP